MSENVYELIKWSKTFACGIEVIDRQHKELIDLVNNLFMHVSGNKKMEKDYFNQVIQELVKYVKIHFATEEKILNATKYPGYIEHKKAHGRFILNVLEIVNDYQDGKRYTLSIIAQFLKDWVLSHIAIMDKEYFEYLHKIATKKADGRLTISIKDIAQKEFLSNNIEHKVIKYPPQSF